MIFFNVKEVRNYLIKNRRVFTLRKPRKRVGTDIAVYGGYYNHIVIGACRITLLTEHVINTIPLIPNFGASGLDEIYTVDQWLALAQKLSGNELNLYLVELV